MSDLRTLLAQYASQPNLPSHDTLLNLIDAALSANEDACTPLLDFTKAAPLPLVIVPDLHARRDFFLHIMDFILPECGESVLSLLSKQQIRVVCVGDLFHSERRCYERWLTALDEWHSGDNAGKAMTEEMVENLSLLQMVTELQVRFPENFFFLKGNHENIMNKNGDGDFSFRKFACEGAQVRDFMTTVYGDALLHVLSLWEHSLPLCAVFPQCVISHGEPVRSFTRKELESGNAEVVLGLTWTRNGDAEAGSVKKTLQNLLGSANAKHAVWIGGHRPVAERYALRQQGGYVQIHNPSREQIALIMPKKEFNPETDILGVE